VEVRALRGELRASLSLPTTKRTPNGRSPPKPKKRRSARWPVFRSGGGLESSRRRLSFVVRAATRPRAFMSSRQKSIRERVARSFERHPEATSLRHSRVVRIETDETWAAVYDLLVFEGRRDGPRSVTQENADGGVLPLQVVAGDLCRDGFGNARSLSTGFGSGGGGVGWLQPDDRRRTARPWVLHGGGREDLSSGIDLSAPPWSSGRGSLSVRWRGGDGSRSAHREPRRRRHPRGAE
jgi:hypothetical protein